jgi:hypothetical protein
MADLGFVGKRIPLPTLPIDRILSVDTPATRIAEYSWVPEQGKTEKGHSQSSSKFS